MRGLAAVLDGAIGHVGEGYQAQHAERAWHYMPDADACMPTCSRSSLDPLTRQIVDAIAAIGEATLVEIARHTGLDEATVKLQLRRMTNRKTLITASQARRGRGRNQRWVSLYALQVRLV